MSKSKGNTSYTFYAFHLPILIVLAIIVLGSGYVVSTQFLKDSEEGIVLSEKAGKSDNPKGNSGEKGKIDKKPTTKQAKTHKKNLEDVIVNLNGVSEAEDEAGNEDVSDGIEEVAVETEETGNETVEAIEKVEKRSKWKTLLFGTDYKNLGILRSSLSHSENAIRKLNRTQNTLQSSSSADILDDQVSALILERDRILNILTENEDRFSILGWFSKLFGGNEQNGDGDETPESTQSTSSI